MNRGDQSAQSTIGSALISNCTVPDTSRSLNILGKIPLAFMIMYNIPSAELSTFMHDYTKTSQ